MVTAANNHRRIKVLTIRGISRRYTIVAWIDGSKIDPEKIAPTANITLKSSLGNTFECGLLVARWRGGSRAHVVTAADRLYAKAFLIQRTSNSTPPTSLSDEFRSDVGAFKLYIDFQVDQAGRVIRKTVVVGKTPFPCIDIVKKWDGEAHPENGRIIWDGSRTVQALLVEARIGKHAQQVERTIDPKGPGTPWIWSLIGFDTAGTARVDSQMFPTYWVFRDGILCGRHDQVDLARFVTGTTARDLKSTNVAAYRPEDWNEPCTEF